MSATTTIAWTDRTFNPWWGCERVSPGCDHCYAETFSHRLGFDLWGSGTEFRFFGDKHWDEPRRWPGGRVFCASMADVFQPHGDLVETRWRLWQLIDSTPHLTWQLLTKRPEQVVHLVPDRWMRRWPHNVWLGTTIEDNLRARLRLRRLLSLPFDIPVRFLSMEPLLERVDLAATVCQLGRDFDYGHGLTGAYVHTDRCCIQALGKSRIGWVIAGGESGPHHRPLDVDAARLLRDQCGAAGIPFFFKQHGGRTPTAGGDLLDGVAHKDFPA